MLWDTFLAKKSKKEIKHWGLIQGPAPKGRSMDQEYKFCPFPLINLFAIVNIICSSVHYIHYCK